MIPQVSRGWSIFLGLAVMLLGFIALSHQLLATAMVTSFMGILLLLGCSFSLIKIFTIHGWGNHFWYIVVAIAYGVASFVFLTQPVQAAIAFTFILGWAILISGIVRVFMAFKLRHHHGAGWVLFSAIVSIILGGLILSQWPSTGIYILGLFFGSRAYLCRSWVVGLGLDNK